MVAGVLEGASKTSRSDSDNYFNKKELNQNLLGN